MSPWKEIMESLMHSGAFSLVSLQSQATVTTKVSSQGFRVQTSNAWDDQPKKGNVGQRGTCQFCDWVRTCSLHAKLG